MTSPYPVVAPIIDLPAPGANTDFLPADFVLPIKGYSEVTMQIAVATGGKVKLIDKPGNEDLGLPASGSIQAIASSLLVDTDYFTLKDGTHTKAFEFERVRAATGTITVVAGSLLVDEDNFDLDDGVNPALNFEVEKFVEGSPATGTITTPAGSAIVDGEGFTLDDGVLAPVTFEFDSDASVTPSATLRPIVFTGAENAAAMKALIVTAINAATLAITAAPGTGGVVLLTNDENLADGNVAIVDTVTDGGFTHTGMLGGVDDIGVEGISGDVEITIDGTETAAQVATKVANAINAAADMDITATAHANGTVTLVNDLAGTVGNVAITEDVGNAGFTVVGMTGGLGTVGVTGGRAAVTIDPAATAAEVAEAIVDAVNGVGSGLTLTASVNEDDATVVDLVNDDQGTIGNIANTENVTDAGFTVSGMSGGYGGDVTLTLDINNGDDLVAGAMYSKTFIGHSGRKYNLQLTVDGIVRQIYVTAKK